ncbi:hypothetical protein VFPPC_08501 [Pochonia chlamydosporia 170]|uniref:Uncharacterized protein n=1 Tax=Pochonia chlamydosporia 170 TaxID=1380566 RepID=A0A179FN84_METCM|nr:hypothetical protein VFPPC_08501 [Pochonia chlamydosporia 170]OAQ67034.1 hypothetical protein VFPPC_08501 [Pochonia chlamydosporia 170]
MKLLEFRTFAGSMAYQPCCKDIDLMGVFKALRPLEPGGDHLFKVARAWSCIVQSIDGLPKDLRWVLATIYNFSNDMMSSVLSEDTMWTMRPWLMYWYDVADALLELFNIPASAPIPDWFLRPSADTIEEVLMPEAEAELTLCRTNSLTSDGNQTVLHHSVPSPDSNRVDIAELVDSSSYHQPGINAWIDAQPNWAIEEQDFDPTPGGFISRKRNSQSPQRVSSPASDISPFQLNPEAIEFDPNPYLSTSPASVSSKVSSNWSRASTPSISDTVTLYEDEVEEAGSSGDLRSLLDFTGVDNFASERIDEFGL